MRTADATLLICESTLHTEHKLRPNADSGACWNKQRCDYRRKRTDPAFAKRWAEAQELGVSKVRDEVFRRAVVGVKRPVFYGGVQIGKVKHYDNRLLWSLLKSHEPETYGPRRPQPVGGAPVDLARRLDAADARVARYEAELRDAAKLRNS